MYWSMYVDQFWILEYLAVCNNTVKFTIVRVIFIRAFWYRAFRVIYIHVYKKRLVYGILSAFPKMVISWYSRLFGNLYSPFRKASIVQYVMQICAYTFKNSKTENSLHKVLLTYLDLVTELWETVPIVSKLPNSLIYLHIANSNHEYFNTSAAFLTENIFHI